MQMRVEGTKSSLNIEKTSDEGSVCCSRCCKIVAMEIGLVALLIIAIFAGMALAGVPFAVSALSLVATPNPADLLVVTIFGAIFSIGGFIALQYHYDATWYDKP
jgi:hypothetical protein